MVSSNATLLSSNPILSPNTTLKTQLNLPNYKSFLTFSHSQFNSLSKFHKRLNLCQLRAQKTPRNYHSAIIDNSEYINDDEDDEFDDFDDDVEEDEEEEEEGDGMFLPSGRMKEWVENKPRGFGEGKVYDTSIEDKLLEEIEQSIKAQQININNLKNNPALSDPKKQPKVKKVIEDVVGRGVRVRVVNLPKKKNVHRDLNAAFKGVSGIVNVAPAVTGSKKTKDPICKGFAFVDFKNLEDATSFVQQFSRQSIPFGRVEKQIKCEIVKSPSSMSSDDESAGSFHSAPQLVDSASGRESDNEFEEEKSFEEDDFSSEEFVDDMFSDQESEFIEADFEDMTENVESVSFSDINGADRSALATGPSSSKKPKKNSKKKGTAKGSGVKVRKLDVPGSAKRLKIREKSLLTDVFAKYGSQPALVSSEGN